MPRPSRRDDVLAAADRQFSIHGIRATGIDTVIAAAGVAKMTLYSHFASKDDLVIAYLEGRDRRSFERLDALIEAATTPLERAMAPVELYEQSLADEGFHGCVFVNAAAELSPEHPGREVVRRHKRQVIERWTELLEELGVPDAPVVARECFLLLEGAFVQAGLGIDHDDLEGAAQLIRARLERETGVTTH